jgi:lysine 2,3-aminomutase
MSKKGECAASPDPFGELKPKKGLPPGLKQRFPDRVLVMTTDKCFGYCPHCTRKFILGKSPVVKTDAELAACIDYVKRHPKVRDVLLSGGDVLTLPDDAVMRFVEAFAALKQIEVIRICTRAPVSNPKRVTDRLARRLAKSSKVWANVHVNTADEARRAAEAARRLVTRGIPVSSQTVLLRGVNDSPRKMLALLQALSAARIRPYYVFQCDPVAGLVEKFGVPLAKAKAIEAYCAERIGGLSLPRFVADLPNSRRKTPLDLLS